MLLLKLMPHSEFPALAPVAVPLALPSMVLPITPLPSMILPIALDSEDPWEVDVDYEFVEFSSSVAAQAIASPMLLLAPASTVVCGPVWNPAPKDIHTEVERLTRAAAAPANAIDELAMAIDWPGATGKAKPKQDKGDAEAVASTARRGRRAK
jgi:hypothetical protein